MPIRTGQTTITTAGTELPLLGAYATGTVTTVAGSTTVTGAGGATFNTTNLAGFGSSDRKFYLLTAGGNLYEIESIISTTALKLKVAVTSAEAGVGYQIYERPQTSKVLLASKQTTSTQLLYVGVRGSISNALGLALPPAVVLELEVNLHDTDIWVDSASNGYVITWLLEV